MGVNSRRPRLTLCTLLGVAWFAAACSLVKPIETPVDQQSRARALVSQGNHADAARLYAELADMDAANRDSYELLSAEQWLAAGDVAQAKRAMAAVSVEARTRQPNSRALVAAEIALAENDGARAIRELDSAGVPSEPDLAQNYWYIRGESAFLIGDPVNGARAFIERERYFTDTAALTSSRDELLSKLRSAAERGQSLKLPPNSSDPVLASWLQRATQTTTVPTESTAQIALLLPLSGRAESTGVAVRDGFLAGYFEQSEASRPRLRIYDTAAQPVAVAYQHAIEEGASFVVGPLIKEDVAALVPLVDGHAPVLALNFLSPDSVTAPKNFYQFALLPEDEARMVARRLVSEGKHNGVVILPDGEWGTRIGAAFTDELARLGGTVVDSGRYEPGRADFAAVIKQTLQVHGATGEPATHRGDAEFIFVAGTPAAERLMVSQLKFHYAGDIPVYSTSDSFEPTGGNSDLEGLSFPDMPWMVSSDPATVRVRDAVRNAWPTQTARRDRLYAFGFDAYRLVPALQSQALAGTADFAGVTGKLHLDDHNRVRRELDWAQMRGGQPAIL